MSDDEKPVALLVLDIDGTVRKGFDEIGRFINGPEDVEVFPEAVTMMREWKAAGGRIIGASNQGGIALGHTTIAKVGAAMDKTFQDSGALFDFISICQRQPRRTGGGRSVNFRNSMTRCGSLVRLARTGRSTGRAVINLTMKIVGNGGRRVNIPHSHRRRPRGRGSDA